MFKNTNWYKMLMSSEKTCLKEDKIKKIHYKFTDGKEMVEEYNLDTEVLLRRAWNVRGKTNFKSDGKWAVEVGDPIPEPNVTETSNIIECKDQVRHKYYSDYYSVNICIYLYCSLHIL